MCYLNFKHPIFTRKNGASENAPNPFSYHAALADFKQNICLQIEFLCLLSWTRVFDNQGGLGLGQVSVAIVFNPPSKVFDKSHELVSHVLAIRLYCSELEASFDLYWANIL